MAFVFRHISTGHGLAERLKPRAFVAMPPGGDLVVRQDQKRSLDHVLQIVLKRGSLWPPRQTTTTEGQFVPDRSTDGARRTVDDVFAPRNQS